MKKHFKDPAHSWDQATSINLDGSKWIIQNLDIATENINAATKLKNEKELNGLLLQLKEELSNKDLENIRLLIRYEVAQIMFDLYKKRKVWGA